MNFFVRLVFLSILCLSCLSANFARALSFGWEGRSFSELRQIEKEIPIGTNIADVMLQQGQVDILLQNDNGKNAVAYFCAQQITGPFYFDFHFNKQSGHVYQVSKIRKPVKLANDCLDLYLDITKQSAESPRFWDLHEHPDQSTFQVNSLKINVFREKSSYCADDHKFTTIMLDGIIDADASFLVESILRKEETCQLNAKGRLRHDAGSLVVLKSRGGIWSTGTL